MFLLDDLDTISRHLEELSSRQREDGKIPILFLEDEEAWVREKEEKSRGRGRESFMLRRYRETGGVEDLTPWTKDGEILYTIGMAEFALEQLKRGQQPDLWQGAVRQIVAAHGYIQRELYQNNRFVVGGDWRDTMVHLGDKEVLVNNIFYCRMLELFTSPELSPDPNIAHYWEKKLARQRRLVNEYFWSEELGYYVDYLGTKQFDTLGQALALLYGVVPEERVARCLEAFRQVDTPYGYMTNEVVPNPITPEEKGVIARTCQYRAIWPFVDLTVVRAMHRSGKPHFAAEAHEQFRKITELDGFWEWYRPKDGKGHGAEHQLWSAALYLMAASELGYCIIL